MIDSLHSAPRFNMFALIPAANVEKELVPVKRQQPASGPRLCTMSLLFWPCTETGEKQMEMSKMCR